MDTTQPAPAVALNIPARLNPEQQRAAAMLTQGKELPPELANILPVNVETRLRDDYAARDKERGEIVDKLAVVTATKNECGKKNSLGKTVVRVPVGSKMQMFERLFDVASVSRTAIVLHVDKLPSQLTQGRKLNIFGGMFTVFKITLPGSHKDRVRVTITPDSRTTINPKPLYRR